MKDANASEVEFDGFAMPPGGWQQVFACSPIAMIVAHDEIIVSANQACADLVGHPLHEMLGATWDTFFTPDVGVVEDLTEAGRNGAERVHVEGPFLRADGSERWVSIDAVLIGADGPGPLTAFAHAIDLTDLQGARAEASRAARLATSQAEVLEMIAVGAPLPEILERCIQLMEDNGVEGTSSVYLIEGDRLEIRAGRAPQDLNQYMRESSREPARSVCDVAITTGALASFPDVDAFGMDAGLSAIADRNGLRAAWSQPVFSAGSGDVVGTISTIYTEPHAPGRRELQVGAVATNLIAVALERVHNEDRLTHQALHDALTDLPNRTLLVDRLEHALARRQRTGDDIAVLFCDLDRFKVVNDSLGHGVGDELLIAFAARLLAVVDPGDTVARFGGDEFVVLLEAPADLARAVEIAARLSATLEKPFVIGNGQEVHLTLSIGVALAGDHRSGDGWLRDADAAMYRAKDLGRNRLEVFDTGMRDAAYLRLQVEHDVRRAVERDEIVVHYQPVVDLRSGRISGVEALARWQHPVRGLLGPADFVSVAEESGAIEQLGRHVLHKAIGDLAGLQSRLDGVALRLGVNLSPRQLHTHLDEMVLEACQNHDFSPTDLLLEITETAVLDSMTGPLAVLQRICDLGVGLAIDDFGTGHSSLTRLGRMPVGQVKIDRSFVAAIGGEDCRLVRMVDAVVVVARSLDLQICAEGVETQAQLDELRRIDCGLAQGYLFARPLPLEALEALILSDPRW